MLILLYFPFQIKKLRHTKIYNMFKVTQPGLKLNSKPVFLTRIGTTAPVVVWINFKF